VSRLGPVLVALAVFAVVNTIFVAIHFLPTPSGPLPQGILTTGTSSSEPFPFVLLQPAFQFLSIHSPVLAPTSWLLVGGVWIWRGRVRSRWESLGFDSDVFRLFMQMKGGKSRLRMLSGLRQPKDRYQLARELDMDWRAVDQHMTVLSRHGLVRDDVAYGKVRIYHLTTSGKLLLQLLEDIDTEPKKISRLIG
jgi:DNA-binding transcriptional ArsR family regulator